MADQGSGHEPALSGDDIEESWRDVPGYEGIYQISDLGRLRRDGYVKKPTQGRDGYLGVMLWKNNHYKRFLLHRLVFIAFIGPISDGLEINHCNGKKTDNRLANLELVTRSQNNLHAYRTGLRKSSITGQDNMHSVLTEDQVVEIRKVYQPHSREFGGKALARKFGVDHSTIIRAVNRDTWKHI